jgi:hypothetical protein
MLQWNERARGASAGALPRALAPVVRFKEKPSQALYREPLLGDPTREILGGSGS